MGLFKRKNSLKRRVQELEYYLGITYTDDGYGSNEYIERPWGELVSLKDDVKALKEKGKK